LEAEPASGLSVQRYYDPMIPRFLSVDPITAYDDPVGQFHRYRYANNNPYLFTDPDGRLSDDPDRQPRGVTSMAHSSPARDSIRYEQGGAPTLKLSTQMTSGDDADRLSVAKTAMEIEHIDGDPDALSYNPDLSGVGSATTDPFGSVEIGPDAFTSWSWLSSVLGHEFEVHVPQYETLGPLRGQRDSDAREVSAHQYNLENATRFRNSPAEIERHQQLRDGYQRRLDEGQ